MSTFYWSWLLQEKIYITHEENTFFFLLIFIPLNLFLSFYIYLFSHGKLNKYRWHFYIYLCEHQTHPPYGYINFFTRNIGKV